MLAAAALAAVLLAAGAVPVPASAAAPGLQVIVTGSDVASAASAVRAAGGEVLAELPLIGGLVGRIPAGAQLGAGVRVSPDLPISFASAAPSPSAAASTVRATVGLPPSGDEGHGVTVAVVDTGVASVPDLDGHLVGHIDVTGSGGGDGFGHGTFMAGLIAASGRASGGAFTGVAPGAQILDVKVARPDGSTDLGSVLKGLQALSERSSGLGVRVVNLSLSSSSPLPYQVDPLNRALRALWRRGITVVVSAGNDGPDTGSIAAPGNDPTLITVGGVNENGTSQRDDDTVAGWASRGPTSQGLTKPDLAAPGASVVGLRSPGSVVDTLHPGSRVGEQYFRGSGTSMSAAVTSGAVAALLAEAPGLDPDDVKAVLTGTAYRAPGLADRQGAGRGGLDLAAAIAAGTTGQFSTAATGGSAAPGDPADWQALQSALRSRDRAAALRAWEALDPAARSWAARSWAGLDGSEQEWAARSWAARSWAGDDWAARSWAGDDWSARSWAGDDWAARSWAADNWAGDNWAASAWSATWR